MTAPPPVPPYERVPFPGMSPRGLGSKAPETLQPEGRGLTSPEKGATLGGKPREGSFEYILKLLFVGPKGSEIGVRLCCGKHLRSDLAWVVDMVAQQCAESSDGIAAVSELHDAEGDGEWREFERRLDAGEVDAS